MPLHVSSTMCSTSGVKIVLYSIWYRHTCRWPSGAQVESGIIIQFNRRLATCRPNSTNAYYKASTKTQIQHKNSTNAQNKTLNKQNINNIVRKSNDDNNNNKLVATSYEGKVIILRNQQVQTDRTIPNNQTDIIIRDN